MPVTLAAFLSEPNARRRATARVLTVRIKNGRLQSKEGRTAERLAVDFGYGEAFKKTPMPDSAGVSSRFGAAFFRGKSQALFWVLVSRVLLEFGIEHFPGGKVESSLRWLRLLPRQKSNAFRSGAAFSGPETRALLEAIFATLYSVVPGGDSRYTYHSTVLRPVSHRFYFPAVKTQGVARSAFGYLLPQHYISMQCQTKTPLALRGGGFGGRNSRCSCKHRKPFPYPYTTE
jgi:hypothetical protein